MMRRIEESTGIKRPGNVLAAMTKLKQVCNHPAQLAHDRSAIGHRSRQEPGRGEPGHRPRVPDRSRRAAQRKFIGSGTLEERIDQRMDEKKTLANLVVGDASRG